MNMEQKFASLLGVLETFCHGNDYGEHEGRCPIGPAPWGGECDCYLRPFEEALKALRSGEDGVPGTEWVSGELVGYRQDPLAPHNGTYFTVLVPAVQAAKDLANKVLLAPIGDPIPATLLVFKEGS